jgi:NADH dehydrogenase
VTTGQRAHEIVIVGGGAGGLELATRLGDTLGRRKRASVTLIDASPSHLWKPLLYEVAAGSLDSYAERLEYLAQGHWHHFRFRLGRMDQLDRATRTISVAPTFDEQGEEIIPRRSFTYDTLVIAVGSVANDFGVPGASEHCIMLDTPEEAREFHRRHINACLRAHTRGDVKPGQLTVGIVGAGATGVELAAELHDTTRELSSYGLEKIDPDKSLKLLIVEASDRILPGLPPRLSAAAAGRLSELGVEMYVNERVVEVRKDGMATASGKFIHASMMVWSAGIKAPDFLAHIDGLETNRANQLVVRPTLQTSRDDNIFALGDCAAFAMPDGRNVPPRAQAAHQQASLLAKSIRRQLDGKPLSEYTYRDYGSLVALGRFSTVGNLMGGLSGGSIMVEGAVARFIYWSLYKMHQLALHGWFKTALNTYAHFISTPIRARIKLHY